MTTGFLTAIGFRIHLVMLMLLLLMRTTAQDTLFMSASGDTVRTLAESERYVISTPDPAVPARSLEVEYDNTGRMLNEQRIIIDSLDQRVVVGISRSFYPDGSVKAIIDRGQRKQRTIQAFWPDGTLRRDDIFEGDSLVSGRCYAQDGKPVEHFPYWQKPMFKGGMDKLSPFLASKIEYPDTAYNAGTQGTVVVQFTVLKDGVIDRAKVIRSVTTELDVEALRVVRSMPTWEPGRLDGEPVRCRFNLPVVFRLR